MKTYLMILTGTFIAFIVVLLFVVFIYSIIIWDFHVFTTFNSITMKEIRGTIIFCIFIAFIIKIETD